MSDLSNAIKHLCEEKNLDYDTVVSTIELALAAAYRKDFGQKNQNVKVEFDPETGKSRIYDVKEVVEDLPEESEEEEGKEKEKTEEQEENVVRFNPKTQIQLSDAQIIKSDAKVGEEIKTELPVPEGYGRMAAQTAKQVVIQKIREMERDQIFNEFKEKENEVISGIIQRREGRFVLVDLGNATGYLSADEQVRGERYNTGERIKVYVKEVRQGHKGPEIILSRKSEQILRKVFYLEIPEVSNGLIEIKSVAREAGSRSKVAIYTESENVDPVGSCVGQKGARIQTIINELNGEKVDIIEYNEDPAKFISNALSPAEILDIELNEEEFKAKVTVSADKLSLAIGKNGQNVRLAARLTGWKIDIVEQDSGEIKEGAKPEDAKEINEEATPGKKKEKNKEEEPKKEEPKEEVAEDKEEEETEDKEVEEDKEEEETEDKEETKNKEEEPKEETEEKEKTEDKEETEDKEVEEDKEEDKK